MSDFIKCGAHRHREPGGVCVCPCCIDCSLELPRVALEYYTDITHLVHRNHTSPVLSTTCLASTVVSESLTITKLTFVLSRTKAATIHYPTTPLSTPPACSTSVTSLTQPQTWRRTCSSSCYNSSRKLQRSSRSAIMTKQRATSSHKSPTSRPHIGKRVPTLQTMCSQYVTNLKYTNPS